jgi:long-chain acyl-CoA synthetase
MSSVIDCLSATAKKDSGCQAARLTVLATEISALIEKSRVIALAADNGEMWLASDFSCIASNKVCVPIPNFFTPAQSEWAIECSGVDTLITDQPERACWKKMGFDSHTGKVRGLHVLIRKTLYQHIPPGTTKITFTSGSTGNPKGVCLSQLAQERVAGSIANIMIGLGIKRHLCALPLPVLLENVAGVYASQIAGAECILPSLEKSGWSGSSNWNPASFLQCVQDYRVQSAIILPQMLKALLSVYSQFDASSLRFLAVGGGRVSPDLLYAARKLGLPVYEGYGLSECSSVVCLNAPDAEKFGTVGRPLPHASVRINAEGELEVAGCFAEGYLGQAEALTEEWLPTGDLASIDSEGFITITGRKKNLLISSFGRNISPEWPESELLSQHGILQVAVFGEARPYLVAVVVAPDLSDQTLLKAISESNKKLPDYAQIKIFFRAKQSFSPENGLATSNGRNKRDAIAALYHDAINSLYEEEKLHDRQ